LTGVSLTFQEQEKGHAVALKKNEEFIARMNLINQGAKVRPSVRLEEKFQHLLRDDKWELE